jgi:carbon starvation protein
LICTLTAGWQKIFSPDVKLGFLSHAAKFQAALDQGQLLAPASSLQVMGRIVFNDRLDAGLCALFMAVVSVLAVYSLVAVRRALTAQGPTALETPYVPMAPTVR